VTNIEKDTIENDNYRKVLYTPRNLQLVLMSIPPGGDVGEEVHSAVDQFIRIDAGKGLAVLNGREIPIEDGFAIVVPEGTRHNFINTSNFILSMALLIIHLEQLRQLRRMRRKLRGK
jgi:mannose-6-phosphate isomerase-like protein (cupin superfamily)